MARLRVELLLLLLISGCAREQLADTTVRMSASLADFNTYQVLENFGRLSQTGFAVPTEVYPASGTATYQYTFSPSLTFPLSSQLVRTVSGAPSAATTTAGAAATIGASVNWNSNFVVSALQNPFTLNNLGILYRSVLYPQQEALSYPPPTSTLSKGQPAAEIYSYQVPRSYDNRGRLAVQPYYFIYSNCVFCMTDKKDAEQHLYNIRTPNDILDAVRHHDLELKDALRDRWLFVEYPNGRWGPGQESIWGPGDQGNPDDKEVRDAFNRYCSKQLPQVDRRVPLDFLGSSNGFRFFVERLVPDGPAQDAHPGKGCLVGQRLFSEFVLLTLPTLSTDVPTPPTPQWFSGRASNKGAAPRGNTEGTSITLSPVPLFSPPGAQP